MPPESEAKDVEIKIRISKDLLKRINAFRHLDTSTKELKNRKAAVAALIAQGLSERPRTEA